MLPNNVVADTLSIKYRKAEREYSVGRIPYIHVSGLIRSSLNDFFCPREFVLSYIENKTSQGGSIPVKMSLLWATGHFIGNFIVRNFIERNHIWRDCIWGDWTCSCGYTKVKRVVYKYASAVKCKKCKTEATNYVETDLFDPAKRIVGHADLIFCVDDIFYLYEFKTIDRQNVVFSDIVEPLPDHLIQASFYYYMLMYEKKTMADHIRFVYVDRSMRELYTSSPFIEISAKPITKKRLTKFSAKAKECHTAIEDKKLPARLCESITCSRAKNCRAAVSCFNRR